MKQATYNKDKRSWKRIDWGDIVFITIVGGALVGAIIFAPVAWWL